MRIAIFGATSQIAKDLVQSFAAQNEHELALYARHPEAVTQWLAVLSLADRFPVFHFDSFDASQRFDALINFVGVGDPAKAAALGSSIFDLTLQFDEMALSYVRNYPTCRYFFMSSGAAYGSIFDAPASRSSIAAFPINNLQPSDWYGLAKLHAECRHRALPHLPIVDIRMFNYFNHTQDLSARFLITDIARAIGSDHLLATSPVNVFRDFVGQHDFFQLVQQLLRAAPTNAAVDCYSKAPIDKVTLLNETKKRFLLRYEMVDKNPGLGVTGQKINYYSLNHNAEVYGYQPKFTSLELIIKELTALLFLAKSKPTI